MQPVSFNLSYHVSHLLNFLLGLAVLWIGAEAFVKGGRISARRLGVSPMLIGLTLGAAATSMPELSVSWVAAFLGRGDMALGNAAGSNIANLGLALGMGALVYPFSVNREIICFDLPLLIFSSLLLWLFTANQYIGRAEGSVLIFFFFAYMLYALKRGKLNFRRPKNNKISLKWPFIFFFVGVILIIGGGELTVRGARELASAWGISPSAIGLSAIALGTSVPEIAVLLTGAFRKSTGIGLGTIIGSNIFNIFLVAGGAALISPTKIYDKEIFFYAPALILFSSILFLMIFKKRSMSRIKGLILLICYFIYIRSLFHI